MSAEEIYNLMKVVNANLEKLLSREDFVTKSELAKYIQDLKEKQRPSLDPNKIAQHLLPALLAQLPKQAPLKAEVSAKEIADLLSPVINRQVSAIEATNERLLRSLPQHLATIDALLAARLLDLEKRDASFQKTAASIPQEVEVNYTGGRLKSALLAFGPMLALLVILKISDAFSKDPVATFNDTFRAYREYRAYSSRLARQNDSLRRVEFAQRKELDFHRSQVHQYRKKFPKAAPYLPPYLPAKK